VKPYYLLILLAILASACGKKDPEAQAAPMVDSSAVQQVLGLGRIEPEGEIVALSSEGMGLIARVLVKEGEHVTKGQVLLELSQQVERARLNQANNKYAPQQAQIAADEAAVRQAEVELKNRALTLARYNKLITEGAANQQLLDEAQNAYDRQLQEIVRLQAVVLGGKQRIGELAADAGLAQAQLAQRSIRAPADGRILNLSARPGAALTNEISFGDFAPDGPITALCEVDELFADAILVGQRAYVRTQGSTDTLALGRVSFAAPYLKKKSLFSDQVGDAEDRRVREVRIVLEKAEKLLLNARVECVIFISERK
jgi:HlyD family secretion protein